MVKNIIRSITLMVLSLVAISCQNNEPEQDVVYKQLSESEFKYTNESVYYSYGVPLDLALGGHYDFDYYFNIKRSMIRVTDGKVELKIDFVKNKSKIDSVYVYDNVVESSDNKLVSETPITKINVTEIDRDWYSIKITDESCIIRIKENKFDYKRYMFIGFVGKALTSGYYAMIGNIGVLQY